MKENYCNPAMIENEPEMIPVNTGNPWYEYRRPNSAPTLGELQAHERRQYGLQTISEAHKNSSSMHGVLDEIPQDGGKTIPWDQIGTIQGADGTSVAAGTLHSKFYVIDPRNHEALSPGFRGFHFLDSNALVVSEQPRTGAVQTHAELQKYAITALNPALAARKYCKRTESADPDDVLLAYPILFHGDTLSITPIDRNTHPDYSQTAPNSGGASNRFGLEKTPLDTATVKAREVFEKTVKKIAMLAAADSETMESLRNPDEMMSLPAVHTSRLQARLHFGTHEDGTNVITLAGNSSTRHDTSGFVLIEHPEGEVIIASADLNEAYSPDDSDYEKVVDEADDKLKLYFDGVSTLENKHILRGSNLHDLRGQLGSIRKKEANKVIKRNIL